MEILSSQAFDSEEIQQVFVESFADAEGPEEGAVIGNLVEVLMETTPAEDIIGFVAVDGSKIVGCIFFTRMTFEAAITGFILSPVAVVSTYQGRGVGQQLINHGLAKLKDKNIEMVLTYGDPAFYSKVGFQQITEEIVKAPCPLSQPIGWLCQSLTEGEIQPIPGPSKCVPALSKPEYW